MGSRGDREGEAWLAAHPNLCGDARAGFAAGWNAGLNRGAELAIETLEAQSAKLPEGNEERGVLDQWIDALRVGMAMAMAWLNEQHGC